MAHSDVPAANRWWELLEGRRQLQIYNFLGPGKKEPRREIPGQLTIDGQEIQEDDEEETSTGSDLGGEGDAGDAGADD